MKIGEGNASPYLTKRPWKHGWSCVSTAGIWPM